MNPPRSPNDPDAEADYDREPTERPPRQAHPFEEIAKQAGRALARSAVRALARGAGEAAQSMIEDGDKVLEKADTFLDIVKDRIKAARGGGRRP